MEEAFNALSEGSSFIIAAGKEKPGCTLKTAYREKKISDGLRDQSITRHPRIDREKFLFIEKQQSNES